MTKIKIMTGIDPKTKLPTHAFVHPFLAGKRREELRVPVEIVDPKTGRSRAGFQAFSRESLATKGRENTSAREIARHNRQEANRNANR